LKKALLLYPIIIFLLGLLQINTAKAQEEFMVYGTIKIQGEKPDSTIITIESDKRPYGRTIILDSTGEFKIWLAYSKEYIINFKKAGFQIVPIAVSTKLPEDVKKCCFTPFDLSFHLFKPDGKHDTLFRKPIVTIRYETKLKSYFYSLDMDYYIQKMYIKSETDRNRKLNDQAYIAKHKDSLEVERKYNSLINSGNLYYSMHQFAMAKQMFKKAQELKPSRKYPSYKLEDIETQVLIFNKVKDSLPQNADSIIAAVIAEKQEQKKQIEYKRKSPEEIEDIFKHDLIKQIQSETENQKELAKRLRFVQNEVINKKDEPAKIDSTKNIVKIDSIKKDSAIVQAIKKDAVIHDTIIPENQPIAKIINDSSIVAKNDSLPLIKAKDSIVQPKPALDTVKKVVDKQEVKEPIIKSNTPQNIPFNKVAYQDSLLKRYPNERTVEEINEPYKKLTKVIINRDSTVNIYLKVEHKWGGIFFFKDNTPYPLENISKSYFEVETKLLSEKEYHKITPKQEHKTGVKTQAKPTPVKKGSKTGKK